MRFGKLREKFTNYLEDSPVPTGSEVEAMSGVVCSECGVESSFGVREEGGNWAIEWCPYCSPHKKESREAMMQQLLVETELPIYTIEEVSSFEITSPAREKIRILSRDDILSTIESNTTGDEYLVYFNRQEIHFIGEDSKVFTPEEEIKYDRDIRPYLDQDWNREDYEVLKEADYDDLEELRESDLQVVEPYFSIYGRSPVDEEHGFAPLKCPSCKQQEPKNLHLHHANGGEQDRVFVEHRKRGCNVLIGELKLEFFDFEFQQVEVEDDMGPMNDVDSVLDADSPLDI